MRRTRLFRTPLFAILILSVSLVGCGGMEPEDLEIEAQEHELSFPAPSLPGVPNLAPLIPT